MKTLALAFACTVLLGACVHSAPFDDASRDAMRAISAAIAKSSEATRTQNIDDFMEGFSGEFVLHDESGVVITLEQLRANVLRDWSLIPRTLDIEVKIESLKLRGDTATVVTSQRWERLMLEKDGQTTDTVLTTKRHKETWRNTADGWKVEDVVELGGHIWVNSKPYTP